MNCTSSDFTQETDTSTIVINGEPFRVCEARGLNIEETYDQSRPVLPASSISSKLARRPPHKD